MDSVILPYAPFPSKGNQNFRSIVSRFKEEYAKEEFRTEKFKYVQRVIDVIAKAGGRVVERNKGGGYQLVSDERAYAKSESTQSKAQMEVSSSH